MLSYNGDPLLKAEFVAHVERHRLEDRIIQGSYGKLVGAEWRGCAIACAARSLDEIDGLPLRVGNGRHEFVAERLGWPMWLVCLDEAIFESLPAAVAREWPGRLARAIPVGVDLDDMGPINAGYYAYASATEWARWWSSVADKLVALLEAA